MFTIAAAATHPSAGKVLETAVFCLATGGIMLLAGLSQRRKQPADRTRKIVGTAIVALSTPFLATAALCLLDAALLLV